MHKYSITAEQLQTIGMQAGKCQLRHALPIADIIRALPVIEEEINKEEFFKLQAEVNKLKEENKNLQTALAAYQSHSVKKPYTVETAELLLNDDSISV